MKKIINGRKYDTTTAELIGSTDNGCFPHDFNYLYHALYRKRTGEYFLHSEGGANTCYAVQDGTGWSSGEIIEPLSYDDAVSWAEKNMDPDEYEAKFGEVLESAEGEVVVSLRVSPITKERLRRMASETGKSQGAILDDLVSRAQSC